MAVALNLRMHRPILQLLVILLGALCVRTGRCQQESPRPIDYRVAHVSAVAGGVYAHADDEWSLLRIRLINRQDQPCEVLCASYFEGESTQQYGRRLWMPAHSNIQTWYPIRIPPLSEPAQSQVLVHTMVSTGSDAQQAFVRDDGGRLQISDSLRVTRDSHMTGIVSPVTADASGEPPVGPAVLAATAQLESRLPRAITTFGDRLLPAADEGLRPFGQIILADDRLLGDEAALSALRHWLFDGGRLWVMLDRIDAELLDALLQNASGCQVVDSITLNDVDIEPGPDSSIDERASVQFEQPVRLVRVLLDDEEVKYTVNGWPAAFVREYGAGQVLVTTLESTAWVTRDPSSPAGLATLQSTGYESTAPLRRLMDGFYGPRPDPPDVVGLLTPRVSQYIGYKVPSRTLVLTLLGGFVVALCVAGWRANRAGRREWLAVAGPIMALGVAAALMAAGKFQQQRVPPTQAQLQLVQPMPGTDAVHIQGVVGLYSQEGGTLPLQGHEGGRMIPAAGGTSGTAVRLIRTDLDEWVWENLPRTPGLRFASLDVPLQQDRAVRAVAQFGPEGLSGQLMLPPGFEAEDALLSAPGGRLAVRMGEAGYFTAGRQDVLGADQYLSADLVSDEQVRRSRMLAEVIPQAPQAAGGGRLMMCCWTDPWSGGVEGDADARLSGAALLMIPLELSRPRAGVTVRLPAPLLSYREAVGPDGLHPSGLYDHRRRQWTSKQWPSSTWLRFQVPSALPPIELTAARIRVQVSGPVGHLKLSVGRDGETAAIREWSDPIGTLEVQVPVELLPRVSADGGMFLRIDAGDPTRVPAKMDKLAASGPTGYWQIEGLELELDGLVGEAIPSQPTAEVDQ